MKILVYGAGNIGSLYAALLKRSGQEVSILAPGARLHEIRNQGLQLDHGLSGERTTVQVDAVEELNPNDAYDLVLVVLPRNKISEVLPILAANRQTPAVMFFGNNAAGPGEMIEALGRDRVLLGFPGAAAVLRDGWIHYLITSAREQPTTIGELDGTKSPRVKAIGESLSTAGFPLAICSNMDAWLKTHVAEISPTLSALYMAGGDTDRLARTRDALVRTSREGYRVLRAHNIPVTPANHRRFRWIPEPLLVAIIKRSARGEAARIKVAHAFGARDEGVMLADEFRALFAGTSIATPAIGQLFTHLNPTAEPVVDGCSELPLKWSGIWVLGAALTAVAALIGFIIAVAL